MGSEVLIEKVEGKIITLVLNRPGKRNSLSPTLLLQLQQAMTKWGKESSARVVILRGAGSEAFSAGYDITQIPTSLNIKDHDKESPQEILQQALASIEDYPYPVIAMINGYCMGAGFELAATCDLRIASLSARFAVPPAKLGVLYSYSGTLKFINLVGLTHTKEILFTGRVFGVQKAKEIGFINEIVPGERLEEVTYQWAQEIAENAPLSLKGAKRIIAKCLSYQNISQENRSEIEALIRRCFLSEDLKEGQKAFLEKRKPCFQGR
jgi:enoyl-CoA hydratase/carnithine racemase